MPWNAATAPWQYDPALLTRFFRSQHAWNGEKERNEYYQSSPEIAGWAAARPFPNMVPTVSGPVFFYNAPGGPSGPRQLLQQRTLPPTFEAGSYQSYLPQQYDAPVFPARPGESMGDLGACCPPVTDMAAAVAQGMKRVMPELSTSIGVQSARASSIQVHSQPATETVPIRGHNFVIGTGSVGSGGGAPVAVTDAVFVTIAALKVPRGLLGVAKRLGVDAESAAAKADLTFRVTVGGQNVPNLDNINGTALGDVLAPSEITVKVPEDTFIRVQAMANTVGALHAVVCTLRGWTFQPSLMTNLDSIHAWRGQ